MKSIYQQQIDAGFSKLLFRGDLEEEYQAKSLSDEIGQLRIALVAGAAFALAFPFIDVLTIDPGTGDSNILLRCLVTAPLILVMLLCTFVKPLQKLLTGLAITFSASFALSSLFLVSYVQEQGMHLPLVSYLLATFYAYFFLGLRFWPALITSISLMLVYFAAGLLSPIPGMELANSAVILCFANMIGATGLYKLEYNRRSGFLTEGVLRFQANQDALTQIPNRSAFDSYYRRAWKHCIREQLPISVALIDVDHFKQFNDFYGHQAGDECLMVLAPIIERTSHRPLDLSARYGGAEFVILLPGCTTEQAHTIIEDLRRNVIASVIEHKASPTSALLTISAGVASAYPRSVDEGMEELVRRADKALYTAKSKGRNRVVSAKNPPEHSQKASVIKLADVRHTRSR